MAFSSKRENFGKIAADFRDAFPVARLSVSTPLPTHIRIDMVHQPVIVGIMATDILQAVAEILPAREMLLVIGKALAKRMALRVNDLRIGQDQQDASHVEPVVGQLVDEIWLVGLALGSWQDMARYARRDVAMLHVGPQE